MLYDAENQSITDAHCTYSYKGGLFSKVGTYFEN